MSLHQIRSDIYNEIGINAGMIDYESKVITGKHPPLLIFVPRGSYICGSEYTINLFTMKPTSSSPNKTLLTKELKTKLLELRSIMSGQPTIHKFISK